VSSCSVYGFNHKRFPLEPTVLPVTEETPCLAHDHYGISKLAVEHVLLSFQSLGLKTTVLRLAHIFYPNERNINRRYFEDPAARAASLWGWVHADDVTEIIERALENRKICQGEHFVVAARDHCAVGHDARELIRSFYPQLTKRSSVVSSESFLSSARAEKCLGFAPKWTAHRMLAEQC